LPKGVCLILLKTVQTPASAEQNKGERKGRGGKKIVERGKGEWG